MPTPPPLLPQQQRPTTACQKAKEAKVAKVVHEQKPGGARQRADQQGVPGRENPFNSMLVDNLHDVLQLEISPPAVAAVAPAKAMATTDQVAVSIARRQQSSSSLWDDDEEDNQLFAGRATNFFDSPTSPHAQSPLQVLQRSNAVILPVPVPTDEGSTPSAAAKASPVPLEHDFKELLDVNIALRQALADARRVPDVSDFVRLSLQGQHLAIEPYRSLEAKVALLDGATRQHAGSLVVRLVLSMQHTLKPSLFASTMQGRPAACHAYANYLRTRCQWDELAAFWRSVHNYEQQGLAMLRTALSTRERMQQLQVLSSKTSCFSEATLTHLQAFARLQKIQDKIESNDQRDQEKGLNPLFQTFPRTRSVLGNSLLTTLYYCMLYHAKAPDSLECAPVYLRQVKFQVPMS